MAKKKETPVQPGSTGQAAKAEAAAGSARPGCSSGTGQCDRSAPSFEDQLARLQEITEELEGGELSLEKSLALYKEGIDLASGCRKTLEQARHTVKIYTGEGLKDFAGLPDSGEF